jgi:transcriptional regulator with XRE-family HTH domain
VTDKSFGEWLKTVRESRGLSQRRLAAAVGVTPGYVWQVEKGTAPVPTDDKLERLSAALGETIDTVFSHAGRIPPDLLQALQSDTEFRWKILRALPWDDIKRRLLEAFPDDRVVPHGLLQAVFLQTEHTTRPNDVRGKSARNQKQGRKRPQSQKQ